MEPPSDAVFHVCFNGCYPRRSQDCKERVWGISVSFILLWTMGWVGCCSSYRIVSFKSSKGFWHGQISDFSKASGKEIPDLVFAFRVWKMLFTPWWERSGSTGWRSSTAARMGTRAAWDCPALSCEKVGWNSTSPLASCLFAFQQLLSVA